MKVYVISFTKKGTLLAQKICQKLERAMCFSMKVVQDDIEMVTSLEKWTQKAFEEADGIVFVGACGIAVRAIAQYLKNKYQDPAVVVIDEKGQFAISLLSGHIGHGNALAKKVAEITNGTPVITTATDVNGIFAVDTWVKENGFLYLNKQKAQKAMKEISATLLEEKAVGFDSMFYYSKLPKGLVATKDCEVGISVSIYKQNKIFQQTLALIAPIVHIGIGCKKNTSFEEIEQCVFSVLEEENIAIEAIEAVATIDLKQNEKGLLTFCQSYQKQLNIFSTEELSAVKGDFTASDFVLEKTGVDNVCERAALCSAQNGKIIVSKRAKNGVTVALAMKTILLSFS
ncbi:cobalamin biosynthesis protein [Clostridium sp. MD294]|uniref:cobalt-precorrin 5A hydrolase n=1 Tax=Clostridium sp. MD294 TaxID=97138 RepID=UPI0002CA22D8|nr:cobalamin biosynthesis protein [Clostridium sp. MD294]NDO45570.1 cobalamin biosynthesis protein CbiG [Clostridium sp. MD294]USF30776.1 Cobalt-precorrin-5A hydrolase [Clostridium sp. MD294]